MLNLRSTRYANVTATLALLFSLAGTGTAASLTATRGGHGSAATQRQAAFPIVVGGLSSSSSAERTKGSGSTIATSLRLAAFVQTSQQSFPDDLAFHSAWSFSFKSAADQIFILTGNIGGGSTPGCPTGDAVSERLVLDGSVYWEHDSDGTTSGTSPNGFVTFPKGKHTLSYDVRSDCSGFPVTLPGQAVVMIPFTLP